MKVVLIILGNEQNANHFQIPTDILKCIRKTPNFPSKVITGNQVFEVCVKRGGLASFLFLPNRYFEEQVAGDISDISWYAKFKKLSYEHLYVKHFGRP